MKNLFLKSSFFVALAATALVFTACNPEPNSEDVNPDPTPTQIVATNIQNAPSNIVTVKAQMFIAGTTDSAEGTYLELAQAPYTNNGFTLTLPAEVPDTYMMPMTDLLPMLNSFIFPVEGKAVVIGEVMAFDQNNEELGSFILNESNETTVGFVGWMYVEADRYISNKKESTASGQKTIFELNMSLEKGWNTIYLLTEETKTDSLLTVKTTYTTQKPANATEEWTYAEK